MSHRNDTGSIMSRERRSRDSTTGGGGGKKSKKKFVPKKQVNLKLNSCYSNTDFLMCQNFGFTILDKNCWQIITNPINNNQANMGAAQRN